MEATETTQGMPVNSDSTTIEQPSAPAIVSAASSAQLATLAKITTRTEIAGFSETYKGLQVYDAQSLDVVKRARMVVRTKRTGIEKQRKAIGSALNAQKKLVDEEAKSLTALLLDVENPLDQQIADYESKKEKERLERERIEAERIEGLRLEVKAWNDDIFARISRAVDPDDVKMLASVLEENAPDFIELKGEINVMLNAMSDFVSTRIADLQTAAEMKRLADENNLLIQQQQDEIQRQIDRDKKQKSMRDKLSGIRDLIKYSPTPADIDSAITDATAASNDFADFAADYSAGLADVTEYAELRKTSIVERLRREELEKTANDAKEVARLADEKRKKEEKDAADNLFAVRGAQLQEIGFTNPRSLEEFIYEHIRMHRAEILIATPAEWDAMFATLKGQISEMRRAAALLIEKYGPDRELMENYINSVLTLPDEPTAFSPLQTDQARTMWREVDSRFEKFKIEILEMIQQPA